MTKEPKLEAAVRIVPEWQDYDQEIKQLQIRFQKEKETGTLYKDKTKEPSQKGKCKPSALE
jgi:UDP-glucose:glycoprotein glucosyltransferase